MKKIVLATLIWFALSSIAIAIEYKNAFGFGYGGYTVFGIRYDREVSESVMVSGAIGMGYLIGGRYNYCYEDGKHCLTPSIYYGEQMTGYGDVIAPYKSITLGADYRFRFGKRWGIELGLNYTDFIDSEVSDNDRLFFGLGFSKQY